MMGEMKEELDNGGWNWSLGRLSFLIIPTGAHAHHMHGKLHVHLRPDARYLATYLTTSIPLLIYSALGNKYKLCL